MNHSIRFLFSMLLIFLTFWVPSMSARADTATAIVPVGIDPIGIAVNTVTNKIYVLSLGSNPANTNGSVTVIDGATYGGPQSQDNNALSLSCPFDFTCS
jgi:DNA-binding beta-propeller fold protein YncE